MGSSTFSRAVRLPRSWKLWKTKPILWRRSRASWSSDIAWIGVPSISTSPDVGRSSPAIKASRVDLPLPEGPSTAVNSPGWIARSIPVENGQLPVAGGELAGELADFDSWRGHGRHKRASEIRRWGSGFLSTMWRTLATLAFTALIPIAGACGPQAADEPVPEPNRPPISAPAPAARPRRSGRSWHAPWSSSWATASPPASAWTKARPIPPSWRRIFRKRDRPSAS